MKIKLVKKFKTYLFTFYFLLISIIGFAQTYNIEVPFAIVEKSPIYPGCENLGNSETRKCFSKKIQKFVHSSLNLTSNGRARINAIFKINKEGKVESIRARGPNNNLKDKVIKLLKKLPIMKPGYQRGKAVIVSYSLPIIINGSSLSRKKEVLPQVLKKEKNLANNIKHIDGITYRDSRYWNKFKTQKRLLQGVFDGNFNQVSEDFYFKTLFLTYISYMSESCKEYLPDNKIVKEFDMQVLRKAYSYTSYTGIKSRPFIDNYTNEEVTEKRILFIDPQFLPKMDSYANTLSKEINNLLQSIIFEQGNYEAFGNGLFEIYTFLSLQKCGNKSLKQTRENLLRFSKGQKSLQNEKGATSLKVNTKINALPNREVKNKNVKIDSISDKKISNQSLRALFKLDN